MSWAARILAEYISAGGTSTITPGTGALNVTGQPVSLRPLHPASGALAITGQQPIVRQTTLITPGTGALNLTGQNAAPATQSEIISNEYVGDGASSRSFASARFVPLAVIVIGKDGSGNVVGAIKTPDMPAGKCMPFLQNSSTGDAARSNRITSLDANGFTVGADLNVTGRNYAYIMFPAGRAKTVNTGTFLGPGGRGDVNSTLNVPSGSGTISGTAVFTATGDEASGWRRPIGSNVYVAGITLIPGGRRLIRNSDGAVLAEVTAAIDANNATGIGYISGSIGGNQWHWEEYYVDVPGFGAVPDMLLYFADDSADGSQPLTVVAPAFMAANNASWQGTGAGERDAFFGSDPLDMRLHVNVGGRGFLAKGVRFHWLAFKANESATGVKMALFQYTSDGLARSITGLDFAPEWMFSFGGNNDFKWAKKTTNIIGASKARAWIDGTGDLNQYDYTFNSDGFSVPAGPGENLNNDTEKYTILLFSAAPVVSAITPSTGALALTGKQATVTAKTFTRITPNTGELHLTGKQPTVTPHVTKITPGTGSLIFTPRNPIRAQKRVITPKTGKLSLTGKAAKTKASKGHITVGTAEDPPTGGLQIVGKQPVLKIGIKPGTGSLNITGQKPFVRPPEFPILTHTGSLNITGQAARRIVTITPKTGALTADGQAAILNQSFPTRLTIDSAHLGFQGQQPILKTTIIPDTGALNIETFNTEPILERAVTNTRITPLTGNLSISGVSPDTTPEVVIDFVRTPFTGALNLQGRTPIVRVTQNEMITPGTGALVITGKPVAIAGSHIIIPGTGALNFTGRQPIQDFGIIPGTGTLGGGPCPPCISTITPNTGALNIVGQPVIVQVTTTPPTPPPLQISEVGGGVGLPHPRKLPFWPKPVQMVRGRIVEPAAGFKGRGHVEESEIELLL